MKKWEMEKSRQSSVSEEKGESFGSHFPLWGIINSHSLRIALE